MSKELKALTVATKQRVDDFFCVYFDAKEAKSVRLHPELAIPMINAAIKHGISSKGRLTAYVGAMSDAVSYQGLLTKV